MLVSWISFTLIIAGVTFYSKISVARYSTDYIAYLFERYLLEVWFMSAMAPYSIAVIVAFNLLVCLYQIKVGFQIEELRQDLINVNEASVNGVFDRVNVSIKDIYHLNEMFKYIYGVLSLVDLQFVAIGIFVTAFGGNLGDLATRYVSLAICGSMFVIMYMVSVAAVVHSRVLSLY